MQQYTFQARQTSSFHNEGKWCYLQMFLFFSLCFQIYFKVFIFMGVKLEIYSDYSF